MHYDPFHPLMCYDASLVVFVVLKLLAALVGLSSVGLLLGVPGVSSVYSDGNSECFMFINTFADKCR